MVPSQVSVAVPHHRKGWLSLRIPLHRHASGVSEIHRGLASYVGHLTAANIPTYWRNGVEPVLQGTKGVP